ncbi:Protein ALP1-like [Frankliniella fusca]|uniref:Protein ALP1-like n=1 Tax=Frankliniella fusca TaxID=407009 RepID=A0AAE1H964_9NEOP|nr:Protein ALP1-like [Frankliniella fusca]
MVGTSGVEGWQQQQQSYRCQAARRESSPLLYIEEADLYIDSDYMQSSQSAEARRKKILDLTRVIVLHQKTCAIRAKYSRRWWVRPLFASHDEQGAWLNLIPQMRETDPDRFYNFMRMTPDCFDRVLELVSPYIRKRSWRKFIEPGERLAITLRHLASGDSALSLSYLFRVSDQCISNIFLETTTVLWHALKDEAFPPINEAMWLRVAAEFEAYWDFPHGLGAIDGRHMRVKASPHCGSRLFNYEKYHSLILLAVVDAKHRFIVVESGANGSSLGLPFVFIGDNAFASGENMVTPFKGKFLDALKRVYNYRTICGSEALAKLIILATAALHNLHLIEEDSLPPQKRKYCPVGYAEHETADGRAVSGRWRNECKKLEGLCLQNLQLQVEPASSEEERLSGDEVAHRYMEYFIDNPVPWQWTKAHVL